MAERKNAQSSAARSRSNASGKKQTNNGKKPKYEQLEITERKERDSAPYSQRLDYGNRVFAAAGDLDQTGWLVHSFLLLYRSWPVWRGCILYGDPRISHDVLYSCVFGKKAYSDAQYLPGSIYSLLWLYCPLVADLLQGLQSRFGFRFSVGQEYLPWRYQWQHRRIDLWWADGAAAVDLQ